MPRPRYFGEPSRRPSGRRQRSINDYFVNAHKKLPKLKMVFTDPYIRVFDDVVLNSGYYTVNYEKEGKMVDLPARYSSALAKRDGTVSG
jgi:hypothetical protein